MTLGRRHPPPKCRSASGDTKGAMARKRLLVAFGVLVLSLSGCDRSIEKCEPADEFVGLNEEQARRLASTKGLEVRVLSDGAIATADLRSDRVNLTFDGDAVAVANRC